MNHLYRLDREPSGFLIRKLTVDWDLVSQYHIAVGTRGGLRCDCPQAFQRGGECRHLKMIRTWPANRIGTGHFYCYETGDWLEGLDQ